MKIHGTMRMQGTMRINEKGHLEIGGCDVVELARNFGTPLYVVDEEHFRANCRLYYRAFTERYGAEVLYAGKTLLTTAICRLVEEEGLSLDVVSGGELYTAYKARFPMQRVYFHGNNKTVDELEMALDLKVGRIMVDNLYELHLLQQLAARRGEKAAIIIRVTPGVEAHTHDYIKTGQIDSKFGLAIETGQAEEAIKTALAMENIVLKGLHCHIGSQIFELEPYVHTVNVMLEFAARIYRASGWSPQELDLGGGLGIYYVEGDNPPPVDAYADAIMQAVRSRAGELGLPVPKVLVEPGRSIAGPAGTTLYTVGSIKRIPGVRTYVAVDGGMSDNPRPALYGSRYEACLANKATEKAKEVVSITGKCCESGDMLIWDIALPAVEPGDILAVSCTGAYNYTMSMNYNRLPRPAMVLVANGRADIIVKRETYDDLLRNDVIPERLQSCILRAAAAR